MQIRSVLIADSHKERYRKKEHILENVSIYQLLAEAFHKEDGNWDLIVAHAKKYGIPRYFPCRQCFELYGYRWVYRGLCSSKDLTLITQKWISDMHML